MQKLKKKTVINERRAGLSIKHEKLFTCLTVMKRNKEVNIVIILKVMKKLRVNNIFCN